MVTHVRWHTTPCAMDILKMYEANFKPPQRRLISPVLQRTGILASNSKDKSMNKSRPSFLWAGVVEASGGKCLVSRQRVCSPKRSRSGGLGINQGGCVVREGAAATLAMVRVGRDLGREPSMHAEARVHPPIPRAWAPSSLADTPLLPR